MPGMLRPDELRALSSLRGPSFDKTLTTEIHDHLNQSALITRSVKTAGQSPAVRTLATKIEQTRTTQLASTVRSSVIR
jgi:hypothetical protein